MPTDPRLARALPWLTAAIILAYSLFFTWRGLETYFDNDDMMNLYQAWHRPWLEVFQAIPIFWSDFYRPLGALFYRGIFAAFGFNPLPFRIACTLLITANLGLFCWMVRLLLPTGRAIALAALFFAFHSRVMEIWFRTATIYDILCFTFFYLAICLYIQNRRDGRMPGPARSIGILCCGVLALDSKEMAVALPVVLGAWELLFRGLEWRRWWLVGVLALMNIPFIVGKQSLPAVYKPEYSWSRFTMNWAGYWNHLILGTDAITPAMVPVILAALLLVAALLRSRLMAWAWTIVFVSMLPVIFVDQRGGYVLYLGLAGVAVYVATLLDLLQDRIVESRPAWRLPLACAVFVLVGWRYGKATLHDQRIDRTKNWLYESPRQVRTLADSLRKLQPTVKPGARILIVEDPFLDTEWTPTFVSALVYQNPSIWVDRPKKMPAPPKDWITYDLVLTWQDGAYRRLKP